MDKLSRLAANTLTALTRVTMPCSQHILHISWTGLSHLMEDDGHVFTGCNMTNAVSDDEKVKDIYTLQKDSIEYTTLL